MEPTTTSTATPVLTPEDTALLSAIGDGTGIFQLATELRMTPSEVMQSVERLSTANFVEMQDDWITLLPDGRSFVKSIASSGKVAQIGTSRPRDVTLAGTADAELDELLATLRSEEDRTARNDTIA
jgi:hypothetical protein